MQKYERKTLQSDKKNTNRIIVIVLVTIIVIMLAIIAVVNNRNHMRSYSYQENDDVVQTPELEVDIDSSESPEPADSSTEEVIPKSEHIKQPAKMPYQAEELRKERLLKKDRFLEDAKEIEEYADNYLMPAESQSSINSESTVLMPAESQSSINSESTVVFQKWDKLLNEVYQYLKTILPENKFEQLHQDELEWIAEKENAIDEAGAEWAGGTGEIMARNMTAIQYTEERCYYLISLIN